MLDWTKCDVVERIPGKVGGVWLFKGTRVPVKALFENLEDRARVHDFLEWFPGVGRAQVEAVLDTRARALPWQRSWQAWTESGRVSTSKCTSLVDLKDYSSAPW